MSIRLCYLSIKQKPTDSSYSYANWRSFHGPAPLHHTLLSGEEYTGVTIQTMHPKHFDQGTILFQTPSPGLEHRCDTVEDLSQILAIKGADMLVDCLQNRLYLYGSILPIPPKSWDSVDISKAANARYAQKVTTADRFVDWKTWSSQDVMRRHRVIGPLWSLTKPDEHNHKGRRLIWSTGFQPTSQVTDINLPVGQPVVISHDLSRNVYVQTCDQKLLKIGQIKIEGGKEAEPFKAALRADMHDHKTMNADGPLLRSQLLSSLPEHY